MQKLCQNYRFSKNPYPFIKSSDFLILSSFYEGYPNVLLEAGCLRIPIISSDCRSGPMEIIQAGKNGYLYKNNNFIDFEKKKKNIFSSKFSISKKINNLERFIEKTILRIIQNYITDLSSKNETILSLLFLVSYNLEEFSAFKAI